MSLRRAAKSDLSGAGVRWRENSAHLPLTNPHELHPAGQARFPYASVSRSTAGQRAA